MTSLTENLRLWAEVYTGTAIDTAAIIAKAEELETRVEELSINSIRKEPAMGDPNRGIYNKFTVTRTDGKDAPGEKHHGCRYFVLDLDHDPHAAAALDAYAWSCRNDYPALADDLMDQAEAIRSRNQSALP